MIVSPYSHHTQEIRVTHEEDKPRSTNTPPSCKRLYPGREWKRFPVDPLCFQALIEPEVGYADTEPDDQTGRGREGGKPGKYFAGAIPEGDTASAQLELGTQEETMIATHIIPTNR